MVHIPYNSLKNVLQGSPHPCSNAQMASPDQQHTCSVPEQQFHPHCSVVPGTVPQQLRSHGCVYCPAAAFLFVVLRIEPRALYSVPGKPSATDTLSCLSVNFRVFHHSSILKPLFSPTSLLSCSGSFFTGNHMVHGLFAGFSDLAECLYAHSCCSKCPDVIPQCG